MSIIEPFKLSETTLFEREMILEALFIIHSDYPHMSFNEVCRECGIKPKWARRWAKESPDWQEAVEVLDAEPELPRINHLFNG